MPQYILCDVDRGVALITLNRPEKLNAIIAEMGQQFDRAMVEAGADPQVRAVVITGAGEGFCVGADASRLAGIVESGPTGAKGSNQAPPGTAHPVFDELRGSPYEHRARYLSPGALNKPVIAAVNGAAAGVGLALAVTCDVRFASETALFRAVFAQRGLTAEVGLAWSLPRLIGRGHANDMLLSGRRVDAEEARHMGLVNKVLAPGDLLDHAMGYAREIAEKVSPRSAAVIKRQLQRGQDQTYAQALELGYHEAIASLTSEDFKEAVAAFAEKRAPKFTGR
jgi:enoyl-CoA hydratase/carnithine racemase